MIRSFKEAENYILENKIIKKIALCGAHDEPALESVLHAKRTGIAEAILIGDKKKITEILTEKGENPEDFEILHEADESASARMAVSLVKERKADIPMKGLMQSSSYLKAILDKETGILPPGKLLGECTVFEFQEQNRLVFITDCAMNIAPSLEEKARLIENAAELAEAFLFDKVKVAAVTALEKVNPKMESTVDADKLAHMKWNDRIVVDGPFALDNAVSAEAAEHKGITGPVAGRADVLLVPDLDAGNMLHKSLHFFAHAQTAGALCGTEYPVVFTSRTDSFRTKYNSILTACMQSIMLKGKVMADKA